MCSTETLGLEHSQGEMQNRNKRNGVLQTIKEHEYRCDFKSLIDFW